MPKTRSRLALDELGGYLEDAIKRHGLTMREAADRFDCTTRHLRRTRAGEYPEAAARYLGRLGYEVRLYADVEPPEEGS